MSLSWRFFVPPEQNHDGVAIFAEIDAIPRAEIDSVLEHAGADTFDVREISKLQPPKCCRNFGGGGSVETPKPGGKRARTCAIEIFEDRQDSDGNTKVTIMARCRWQVAGRLPGWAFGSRIQREPWGAASPPGAILVRFVAVPVSDRRGPGTYRNYRHDPGFGLRRSPVNS